MLRSIPLLVLFGCLACAEPGPEPVPPSQPEPPFSSELREVTIALGFPAAPIEMADGTLSMPEIMGPGVGLLDHDGDGDLDVVELRENEGHRLWQRQSDGRFLEVGAAAGLGSDHGQGLAVGDVDGDGDLDLFLANFGADRLLINSGDGTFLDATASSGIDDEEWSSSATLCDFDGDGDLDLYVARYLRYAFRGRCTNAAGEPDYCPPSLFDGLPDRLYRNDGQAHFTDVAAELGLLPTDGGREAKGLGVVCVDLTGDGRLDFFVANDGEPNHLWVQRDGRFVEEGIVRGVAVNGNGAPEASMGIAVGDVNRDGRLDLHVTHVRAESNTLYLGHPGGLYVDGTTEAGLGRADLGLTGFGTTWLDLDHDGDLDLAVVNGRVYRAAPVAGAGLGPFWNLYAEPDLLWLNEGNGKLVQTPWHDRIEIGRGLARGDLDDDGDLDLVVSTTRGGLRVYRNDAPRPGMHWLGLRLPETAIAATVVAGNERWFAPVLRGASYQSSHDPRAHFGLGPVDNVDGVEVRWSDGSIEWFAGLDIDRYVTLNRGEGERR